MNRAETLVGLKLIAATYRDRFVVTPDTITVWEMVFRDVPSDAFIAALKEHILTETQPPVPADITRRMARHVQGELTWNRAFEMVQIAVRRFGYPNAELAIERLPVRVARAIGGVPGFRAFCESHVSNLPTFRAQFRQAFDVESGAESRAIILGSSNNVPLALVAAAKVKEIE